MHKRGKAAHTTQDTKTKEEKHMNCHCSANRSIQCTVTQCKHHCDAENYCSLEQIQVGTHETDPSVKECTDCMSFAKK